MSPSPISRTDRLATNAAFSGLSWFMPIVLGFFTTPILIRALGIENYGLYAVITGLIAYSFGFGVGKIAAKYVAEYRATGEVEKIGPVISATFGISLMVAGVGGTVLAVFARPIVTDLLLIEGAAAEVAVNSLYIASGLFVAALISQIFQYTLQGLQHFGTYLLLTNLNGFVLGVGNIVIALSGGGVVALLGWNLAVVAVMGMLFTFAAVRSLPDLKLSFSVGRDTARSVATYGGSIILYQISANILFIFERTFVVRKFGAEGLAFYSVPMMLAIYLHSFIGSFAVVLFPAVNELLTDSKRQAELYQKASKIILAIVTFVVVTFICTGRAGLEVWINREVAVNSYSLLVIHSITFGIVAMGVVVWQIAEGFGHPRINAFISATCLLTAVPLMLLTADTYGTEGMALSRLAGASISLPMMLYVERRFLGKLYLRFWGAVLIRVAIAATAAALLEIAIVHYFAPSWPMLAAAGSAGLAGFGLILYASGYFTADERNMLLSLVTSKLRFALGNSRSE